MTEPCLFRPQHLADVLARIERLQPDAPRQWGKMTLPQMLAHCRQPLLVAIGELKLRRSLLGVLFGRMVKKQLLAPTPLKKNLPTAPQFKVSNPGDFAIEKAALLELVQRFGEAGPAGLTREPHPFFGPLTADEWQVLQWKHLDHHLRQFGV